MVGGVGVEPTHPGGTDLQSAATLRLRRPPKYLAGRGRLELPRHLTMTYKFSKLAPSPTWVPSQTIYYTIKFSKFYYNLINFLGIRILTTYPNGIEPYHISLST